MLDLCYILFIGIIIGKVETYYENNSMSNIDYSKEAPNTQRVYSRKSPGSQIQILGRNRSD